MNGPSPSRTSAKPAADKTKTGGDTHTHRDGSTHKHGDDEHADHEGHDEIKEAIAKLPEADRATAEKQEICPVSGGKLGSMGMPYKVTVEGQDVFLCCKGCEGAIKEDPQKYLAKLKE